jgi:copper(I)-binding protein
MNPFYTLLSEIINMRYFLYILLLSQLIFAETNHASDSLANDSEITIPEIKDEIQLKILKGTANGAAYVSIYNPSREVVTLYKISINENALDRVELHDHIERTDENGQKYMEMIEIPTMEIQPGGTLRLAPGGKHIMLMDIKQTLCAFKQLTFTFHFRNSNNQTFETTKKANLTKAKRCEK